LRDKVNLTQSHLFWLCSHFPVSPFAMFYIT
jgi:hypothetical protein